MKKKLRKEIQQMLRDTQKLGQFLIRLEHDYHAWDRNAELSDLATMAKQLKLLEADVSILLSKCAELRDSENGNGLFEDLHQTFVLLNTLFNDVKQARIELDSAYIQPKEIRRLEIDWGRLKKTISQIQEDLHNN